MNKSAPSPASYMPSSIGEVPGRRAGHPVPSGRGKSGGPVPGYLAGATANLAERLGSQPRPVAPAPAAPSAPTAAPGYVPTVTERWRVG